MASPCSSCEDGAGFWALAHARPTAVLASRESGSVVPRWRELLAESKQPGASQGCCVDDLGMLERFSKVCWRMKDRETAVTRPEQGAGRVASVDHISRFTSGGRQDRPHVPSRAQCWACSRSVQSQLQT